MQYYLSIIATTCITLIGVVSIFPLTGLTGLFSFGQAAYMAIGAYVSGLCAIKLGLPIFVCIILGVMASGIAALIVGFPTLKLRKDYFALMSLALGEAIAAVLNWLGKWTGGASGLSIAKTNDSVLFIVISAVAVIVLVALLKKSRFGRMSLAIKHDELAAKSFGINVFWHKMKIYILTSMIAGYAGAIFAFYQGFIDPASFGWTKSSEWVIFLFFGGVNSLTGTIISTIFLQLLPQLLQSFVEWRVVIYCVLILIILNFRPQGLMGEHEITDLKIWKMIFKRKKARKDAKV